MSGYARPRSGDGKPLPWHRSREKPLTLDALARKVREVSPLTRGRLGSTRELEIDHRGRLGASLVVQLMNRVAPIVQALETASCGARSAAEQFRRSDRASPTISCRNS